MISFDLYAFGNGFHRFDMRSDIPILSCLSLQILWAPWALDPGPWSDGLMGRIGRTYGSDGQTPIWIHLPRQRRGIRQRWGPTQRHWRPHTNRDPCHNGSTAVHVRWPVWFCSKHQKSKYLDGTHGTQYWGTSINCRKGMFQKSWDAFLRKTKLLRDVAQPVKTMK